MVRRPQPPSQTWRTFLANHIGQLVAADFLVVPTATGRLLFVLVLLAHERRRIVHVAVTNHPTAEWTAQQLREASRVYSGSTFLHAPPELALASRTTVPLDRIAARAGGARLRMFLA